jgi:hypothetical protein
MNEITLTEIAKILWLLLLFFILPFLARRAYIEARHAKLVSYRLNLTRYLPSEMKKLFFGNNSLDYSCGGRMEGIWIGGVL